MALPKRFKIFIGKHRKLNRFYNFTILILGTRSQVAIRTQKLYNLNSRCYSWGGGGKSSSAEKSHVTPLCHMIPRLINLQGLFLSTLNAPFLSSSLEIWLIQRIKLFVLIEKCYQTCLKNSLILIIWRNQIPSDYRSVSRWKHKTVATCLINNSRIQVYLKFNYAT